MPLLSERIASRIIDGGGDIQADDVHWFDVVEERA